MTCTVKVPSPLRAYTKGEASVRAQGDTVHAVLADLERRFPGMRFRMIDEHDRIREHMRVYVNTTMSPDLNARVADGDEVHIICALSGG